MFFKSVEKKLEQHAKHIQEMDDNLNRLYQVLEDSSSGIDHDMSELTKKYQIISGLSEFTKIINELKNSPL